MVSNWCQTNLKPLENKGYVNKYETWYSWSLTIFHISTYSYKMLIKLDMACFFAQPQIISLYISMLLHAKMA